MEEAVNHLHAKCHHEGPTKHTRTHTHALLRRNRSFDLIFIGRAREKGNVPWVTGGGGTRNSGLEADGRAGYGMRSRISPSHLDLNLDLDLGWAELRNA